MNKERSREIMKTAKRVTKGVGKRIVSPSALGLYLTVIAPPGGLVEASLRGVLFVASQEALDSIVRTLEKRE